MLDSRAHRPLRSEGINSLTCFARADIPSLGKVPYASESTLARAQIQAKSLIENKIVTLANTSALPNPDLKLFFDVEGDHLIGIDKKEIFYSPKEASDNEIGWDLKKQKFAGRIDHISFHQDGNVHVKYKKVNRDLKGVRKPPLREYIGKLEGGLIPINGIPLTPLIIDSIYRLTLRKSVKIT